MSYDVNTMDALIVSIQMVLVERIIHPAKPYMYPPYWKTNLHLTIHT